MQSKKAQQNHNKGMVTCVAYIHALKEEPINIFRERLTTMQTFSMAIVPIISFIDTTRVGKFITHRKHFYTSKFNSESLCFHLTISVRHVNLAVILKILYWNLAQLSILLQGANLLRLAMIRSPRPHTNVSS